jgi:hypothetical protein
VNTAVAGKAVQRYYEKDNQAFAADTGPTLPAFPGRRGPDAAIGAHAVG